MRPLRIAIVGPGRLGRSARKLLGATRWEVTVVGRGEPIPKRPLTWLTVPDRAIAEAAAATPVGGVVLHASGASTVEVLRPHRPAGSLHPLMTFPGPEVGLPDAARGVPAAVAGDAEAREAAHELADALGFSAFEVPGDRRLYHAAAVLAGNFATVLLAEASQLLAAAGVDAARAPALLAPLALASLENAAASTPSRALTGPVARGDNDVIEGHLDAIRASGHRDAQQTYEVLLEGARRLAASTTEKIVSGAEDPASRVRTQE